VSLRLATAYFRTGHVHEAREVFSRMLECPTIGRFCDVAAAQIEAGDLDGALQTARSMEALMTSPLIEAGDWGGLPVNLAVALAAREGPDAGLALLQNLPIDGTLFADGLVALAEQAVTVGLRPVARALLASA
jgi:predicted RNA polymerase sigma factor